MKKKSFSFFCMFVSFVTISYAQHTPEQMSQKMLEIEKLFEKYDDEQALDSAYLRLNEYIGQCSFVQNAEVEKAIWHNYMARTLSGYVNRNQWRLAERTAGADYDSNDLLLWDLQKYVTEILKHYQLSISSYDILKNVDVKEFDTIIQCPETLDIQMSLYDFFSQEYLNFLQQPSKLPASLQAFEMNQRSYFANAETFAGIEITASDTLSPQYLALKQWQEMTRRFLSLANHDKLIRSTLERLNYVYSSSSLSDKEKLYENALLSLFSQYESETVNPEICLAIAHYYYRRASSSSSLPDDYVTALTWYEKVKNYSRTCVVAAAESMCDNITETMVALDMETPCAQGKILFEARTKNCDSLYIAIVPTTYAKYVKNEIFSKKNVIFESIYPVNNTHLYRQDTTVCFLPELPVGEYAVWISPVPYVQGGDKRTIAREVKGSYLHVTNIFCQIQQRGKHCRFWFTDRRTGEPLNGVQVKIKKSSNTVQKYSSDAEGIVSCDMDVSRYEVSISKQNDVFIDKKTGWCYDEKSPSKTSHIQLFTDRKIYRPLQKINYKCIAYQSLNTEASVLAEKKVCVVFRDGNYQELYKDTLLTNDFGSVAGEYTIPASVPLGSFYLEAKLLGSDARCSSEINVEEYKRPQFEVRLESPSQTFRIGSEVTVKGKAQAYAGYPLANAHVAYRVRRVASFPFRYYWRYFPMPHVPEMEIAHGQMLSDTNGEFELHFLAEGDNSYSRYYPVYRYEVTATVTDQNGEMHEAEAYVVASQKSLLISASLPEYIDAEQSDNQFLIKTTNLSGIAQHSQLEYCLSQQQMPEQYLASAPYSCLRLPKEVRENFPQFAFHHENEQAYWPSVKQVAKGVMVTSDSSLWSIPNLKSLPAGAYRLELWTKDAFGEEVREQCYFTIIRARKVDMPIYKSVWCLVDQTTAQPGEKVTFTAGSYRKNAVLSVKMVANDRMLREEIIQLNGKPKTYSYMVEEKDRGSVRLYVTSVYEGVRSSETASVSIPFDNKKIDFEWITFRSKLHPGETTTVKFKLKEPAQHPAELLAAMYDASLDALASPNIFALNWMQIPSINYWWQEWTGNTYYNGSYYWRAHSHYETDCPSVSWKYGGYRYRNFRTTMAKQSNYMIEESEAVYGLEAASTHDVADGVMYDMSKALPETGAAVPVSTAQGVSLRSNFAETAFFFPFIQVKENGEVELEFTMPESLTKWKMLGLAHTRDMSVGSFEKYLETQKELMVVPNWPRFVYERDTLLLTTKVVNLTSKTLKGTITLQCYDAATGKPLVTLTDASLQLFEIAGNQTEKVVFKLQLPSDIQGVTCRMVAKTEGVDSVFSDGEEFTLPVLSKRMLLTEALPVYITRAGTKQFVLKLPALMDNTDFASCTFHFTPDPKWNAVLALPYLMSYPYECCEQIFNRLYANILAEDIVRHNPKLESLLKKFSNENPEAFCSKLSQDESLKQILLTESPWVNDALREEAQIQNISTLFRQKALEDNIRQAVDKLLKAQNSDGGWPWFSGGRSSLYITQYLLSGAGRLLEKGAVLPEQRFLSKGSLQKAVRYMDAQVDEWYRDLKKSYPNDWKKQPVSPDMCHYLFARSFYAKNVKSDGEAYAFFMDKLEKEADKMDNIYLKTMAALTLYRVAVYEMGSRLERQDWNSNARLKKAKQLMESIRAQAQQSEEMGMFWKKQGRGYYWYESQIERQALLIDAFELILQDMESVQQMKIWLLQQKRTQNWGTTRSTAEACHALLANDVMNDELSATTIRVRVGEEEFSFVDTLQLPFQQDMVSCLHVNTPTRIELSRQNDALSYGAIFYQFYQDMDEIQATASELPLSVQRDIYRVDLNQRGEVLGILDGNSSLKVGDKVRVRMTVSCDRDLEFVHLKDLRAAAFEPMNAVSQHRFQDGLYYYESYRDASVNFFFDRLPKGKYVFEYTMFVTQAGTFNSGYATLQCMYAPEFVCHSKSRMIQIDE